MTDTYSLTIVQKALEQICNEMTITLRKTSFSPNIKERMDFSCALFTATGELMASKEGIPVHLGSMEDAVQGVINKYKINNISMDAGDIIIHNKPDEGGTHLPDINLIYPIFTSENRQQPSFYAACRAHHADVGGKTPGSMPSHSETLFEEGIQIPGVKLWEKGEINNDLMELLLSNVRTPRERKGDFFAQRSALLIAEKRLLALLKKYSIEVLVNYVKELFDRSSIAMQDFLTQIPDDINVTAIDYLDNDGSNTEPVPIQVKITKSNPREILIDFTGSSKQRFANCNATSAITKSCTYYVFRYLVGDFPTNAGMWKPIKFILPNKSIVNASYPAATSSGNVETSQRIVDVLFKALSAIPSNSILQDKIPAASQGTMNNITIGGYDNENFFSYYETIAGGSGATAHSNGESAVHTNMTNTLNTPIEAFELAYPMRITQYKIREQSGGNGKLRGGDGLIREYEVLCNRAQISMQSERRIHAPYGLFGGENGLTGENIYLAKEKEEEKLDGRFTRIFTKGDKIKILTPGGGGFRAKS